MRTKLNVLLLAAEARPFVTVGGLGEVSYALAHALMELPAEVTNGVEIDVRLALPFYGVIDRKALDPRTIYEVEVPSAEGPVKASCFEVHVDGIPFYLISGDPIPRESGPIYAPDAALDGPKFVFFSLAALELARSIGWRPDIVHANDWHTAPALYAMYLHRESDEFYARCGSVITVHNLPYLGAGAGHAMSMFNLPPAENSSLPFWAQDLPLPLGLLAADRIVTVSPGYAGEILTPEFGSGLDEFLTTRLNAIQGILNGIDTDHWNPETDSTITYNFSAANIEPRDANKTWLQKEFDLEVDPRIPLLGMISRLDNQKGVDLVMDALLQLTDLPWQAIILGSGQPELESAARRLEKNLPERVRAVIAYDKVLSRRIYGGADILMIPSRYEPCGLVQMIAMRYGCVPVARATGGLKDTIHDYSQTADSTGFLFENASASAFNRTLRRAIHLFADSKEWKRLQLRCMAQDFTWDRSARLYYLLYQSLHQEKNS